MSGVAEELEAIFASNRSLRKDLAGWHAESEKQKDRADRAEAMVKRLSEKIAAIEANGDLMDGWDEQYLFDHRVELKFRRKSDGTKSLTLRPRVGQKTFIRQLDVPEGGSFMKLALERASGRTRAAKAK